jgi:hypothetical protein
MGLIFGVFAVGSVLAFIIFILADIDLWIKRARAWRRLAWAAALFWFNVEVWGRVAWVLINWQ